MRQKFTLWFHCNGSMYEDRVYLIARMLYKYNKCTTYFFVRCGAPL